MSFRNQKSQPLTLSSTLSRAPQLSKAAWTTAILIRCWDAVALAPPLPQPPKSIRMVQRRTAKAWCRPRRSRWISVRKWRISAIMVGSSTRSLTFISRAFSVGGITPPAPVFSCTSARTMELPAELPSRQRRMEKLSNPHGQVTPETASPCNTRMISGLRTVTTPRC